MGRLSRHETKARMRIMAKAMVDMERGVYEWEDGRAPTRPDGTPIVVRREILRAAGYSVNNKYGGNLLFSDPYFLRQCAYQRAKRDHDLPAVIDEDGIDPERVLGLGVLMFTELEKRIIGDLSREPGTKPAVSTAQLMQYAPTFIKMGLELELRSRPPETPPLGKLAHLHLSLGDTIVNMNPEERDKLVADIEGHANERMAELRGIIDLASGKEEEDDELTDAEYTVLSPSSA